jgi:hypothetical protein
MLVAIAVELKKEPCLVVILVAGIGAAKYAPPI